MLVQGSIQNIQQLKYVLHEAPASSNMDFICHLYHVSETALVFLMNLSRRRYKSLVAVNQRFICWERCLPGDFLFSSN